MLALLTALLLAQSADFASWTHAQREEFLLSAKVVKVKTLTQGITNSRRATLEKDGVTHDAHVQAVDEYKAQFQGTTSSELNFKDTYKFNLAAYRLDRLMDLNMVPVTVERKVEGRSAAFTWWIDDAMMTELDRHKKHQQPPPQHMGLWNQQMWVLRAFDQLIANTDRNLGNVVICNNWDIWLIDHTRAFRARRDLLEKKNLEKCDREFLGRLRKLDRPGLERALKPYVGKMEIDGLLARRDAIVSYFDQQVASQGEASVLFNYLPDRSGKYGH